MLTFGGSPRLGLHAELGVSRRLSGGSSGATRAEFAHLATMKRLKRIGRAKYKYEFEVNVCDVRGVPAESLTSELDACMGDRTC